MRTSRPATWCGPPTPANTTWTWARWRAIARHRIFCAPWPSTRCRMRLEAGSALGTQDFADFPVDAGRVAGGIINQFHPFLVAVVELGLGQQIGSLHDGF